MTRKNHVRSVIAPKSEDRPWLAAIPFAPSSELYSICTLPEDFSLCCAESDWHGLARSSAYACFVRPHPFHPSTDSMASTFHAGSSSYPPPPTFSQDSADNVMNGIGHSQSTLNSFDGRQSIASTPTPTPPTSRHQQNGPYSMPNYASMNGTYNHITTPKKMAPQQNYSSGQKPEIYTVWFIRVDLINASFC